MRIAIALLLALSRAEGLQDVGKDELKEGLHDVAPQGDWVYDDLDAARAQARKSGKPVLALARCVP
jgi:hypothetical protein